MKGDNISNTKNNYNEKEEKNRDELQIRASWYTKIEESGINYINKYKYYLLLSALIPIFLIIIQIINTFYAAIVESSGTLLRERFLKFFILIIPRFNFMTISIIALVKFIFMFKWNKKLMDYKIQYAKFMRNYTIKDEDVPKGEGFPLTKLFYEIISQMRFSKGVFIVLNVFCIMYFFWTIFFFLISPPIPPPRSPTFHIIGLFNYISQILLIIYLIFEWRHFYRWNKKLNKLSEFEKTIYSELFQSE